MTETGTEARSSGATGLIPVAIALVFALFPLRFAHDTANNDLFIQLLTADGFLSGRGFGYSLNGTFQPIAER
ncbi:MAG TPA: hypothetical protein VKG23_03395, partial [Thermoanaerobaculia bacterium]|nr:hypothetical protein [Thermoanaerobaculia bacterium]